VLRKETRLALTIGLATELAMAGIAYLWKGQALRGRGGGGGHPAPPEELPGVIITTFTDVFGFFSFLGLATLLIGFLL
jgi:hypothetical protein